MAALIGAPHQYKQPSRKGKKAWRKNVDVSDIQTGLENLRQEIIQGGVIVEKGSDELFAIDTAGSKQILKSYNRLHKPLKSDEILAQRSAVPAVDNRKRSGITDGLIEPQEKRRKGNGVHPQEFNRLRIIARGGGIPHKDIVEVDGAPSYDPWSATTVNASQDSHYNYLDKPRPIKPPKTLKEAPNSLVEGVPHFPAVPKPQAGKSYNPMFEDWDRLLVEEGKKELDAERKRLKEAEEERTRLERIANAQEEKDGVQTEDESAWEGFESGYDGEDHLKRRRPERKTQAQRNKAKRRKEAESQAKQEADLKRRTRQAQRIREIAQEVNNQKLANAGSLVAANNSRLSADKYAALRRRKLGKSTIPEQPLELVLPEELQDSLRLLKPEGNLLTDRFRNILIRGKVEGRRRIHQPKKARRTMTEKWTSKDFSIPV